MTLFLSQRQMNCGRGTDAEVGQRFRNGGRTDKEQKRFAESVALLRHSMQGWPSSASTAADFAVSPRLSSSVDTAAATSRRRSGGGKGTKRTANGARGEGQRGGGKRRAATDEVR